ncbi:MAG: 16S rRNA (guanine(966)-N(2))-methyltransferase RsmD [Caldisericia bacterium]|nr:16S rRNA (guanine(966)-N(2))-methyltransferase RsmD [Caldisericia bacterium]
MKLRIVGGTMKGRQVILPLGFPGRPTRDMVKEALFDILSIDIRRAKFLDLFAGSGTIGIEAVSRGAIHAWCVDKHPMAIKSIAQTIKTFCIEDKVTLERMDAGRFMREAWMKKLQFDIIFCDPPYEMTQEELATILENINETLAPQGLLVVEMALEVDYPDIFAGLTRFKEKRYGGTKLNFWSRPVPGDV